MLNWYFPPANGGVSYGFNDASQQHFRDNPWEQTIREVIQNSLDAIDTSRNGPVKVYLSEIKIPASEIGVTDLKNHISSALDSVREEENSEGISFYEHAIKVLKNNEINVLAITDRNTTGLVDKKWKALIYHEGITNKGDLSAPGGSFGIGKNAPYLVSALKTVCYSTRYLKRGREEKFIARCNISSHKNPKPPHEELQHIGFGTKTQLEPNTRPLPTEGSEIYKKFRLDESGSGIFIMGFEPKVDDWIKIAKKSIAHNFFAAIHEKKLEIFINSDSINYETLDAIFENSKKNEFARHYYHIIRDGKITESIDTEFGKFTLQLSLNKDLPNTIAYINRRGMFITDARTFKDNPFYSPIGKGWASYAAVVTAADDSTDQKIRKMEPPNHKSIQHERNVGPDSKLIKSQLKEVQRKIKNIISGYISSNDDKNDILLSEFDDILPMPGDHNPEKGNSSQDEENQILTHRQIIPKLRNPEIIGGSVLGGDIEYDPNGDEQGNQKGDGRQGTTDSAISGRHSTPEQHTSFLERKRIVRNDNILSIAFTPLRNDGESICFAIKPAGEEKKDEDPIPIKVANTTSPNSDMKISKDRITLTPKHNRRVVIDLEIPPAYEYTGYDIVEILSNSTEESEK